GNSEPGNPDASLSDAKKRVDNMAAGWIKSGARAVIAEPYTSGMYGGAAWWIRQLFTTHQAVDTAWLNSPSRNNHVLSFSSNGTPQALDTRLRLEGPAIALGGATAYPVVRLDGSASGFMFAADLRPRDSQSPNVWTADSGTGAFSPNDDGSQDTIAVAGQMSEAATSRVSFRDINGNELYATGWAAASNMYSGSWDGRSGGTTVPDGTYQ